MDEQDALAKLSRMVDATAEPVLSEGDLEDLVASSARPDSNGTVRSDGSAWTPTWDLNAGAAEGWARKAGKAAARFSFAEDGQRFERAQIHAHCIQQHQLFADRSMGTLDIATDLSS